LLNIATSVVENCRTAILDLMFSSQHLRYYIVSEVKSD